jgi:hypothetical protein
MAHVIGQIFFYLVRYGIGSTSSTSTKTGKQIVGTEYLYRHGVRGV